MQKLKKSKSFSFNTNINSEEKAEQVVEILVNMPGVIEATLVHGDTGTSSTAKSNAVAYLKVDDKVVDLPAVKALLN
jgi:anti-sigma factor ChrR (cupin superfamily)